METTIVYRGSVGIMEKKMETTIVYRGSVGSPSLVLMAKAIRSAMIGSPSSPYSRMTQAISCRCNATLGDNGKNGNYYNKLL